jgi:hypothetical protein
MTCRFYFKLFDNCDNIEFKDGLCKKHFDEDEQRLKIKRERIDSAIIVLSTDNVYIKDKDMFLSDIFNIGTKYKELKAEFSDLFNFMTS